MAKKLRFAELIKHYGKPEILTLWTKPENNSTLQKAIKENRVLTVTRTTVGTKKDIGHVGFHQEHSATYLIFPEELPRTDADVIGINFDLVESEIKTVPVKAYTASKARPKPEPVNKKFRVTILRTAQMETTIEVEAPTIHTAEEKALNLVKSQIFKPKNIQEEIKAVAQIS